MTQQRKKCGKGGFTLVELVVTLVILSILFAIAVPSLLGYIHLSQFRKNESYAKTMYLSAESELTYLRTGGEWESFCSKVKKEGVLNQSFDESDEDRKKLVGRIYGIRLDAGEYAEGELSGDGALVGALLSQDTYDKSVLNAAICIEIDVESGQVYSVFYGTNCKGLYYGSNEDSKPADMSGSWLDIDYSKRDRDTRREERLGYYSVQDAVNAVSLDATKLKITSINLVNGETLSLNWSSNVKDQDLDKVYYEVKLYSSEDKAQLLAINIPGRNLKTGSQSVAVTTKDNATKDYTFPVEYDRFNKRATLVLDGMMNAKLYDRLDKLSADNEAAFRQSSDTSITRFGGKLANPLNVYAAVQVFPDPNAENTGGEEYQKSDAIESNKANTLFGDGTRSNNSRCEIETFRHLSNIRYMDTAAAFAVTARSLDWTSDSVKVYGTAARGALSVSAGKDIGFPSIPALRSNQTLDGTGGLLNRIAGVFTGGNVISNLKLDETSIADDAEYLGLFRKNAGTIYNLRLLNPQVEIASGKLKGVGAVCGYSNGSLKGDNVDGTQARVKAALTSAQAQGIGGVAGVIEVGDSKSVIKLSASGTVTGTLPTGDTARGIGGIAGSLTTNGAAVKTLTNSAAVTGNRSVGGIAGYFFGKDQATGKDMADCQNEGLILSSTAADNDSLAGHYIGGIVGYAHNASLSKCRSRAGYADGYTYKQEDRDKLRGRYVGGIVGYGEQSVLYDCETEANGYVLGSEYVGGIIGALNQSDTQTALLSENGTRTTVNASYVIGNSYVGGIIGENKGGSTIKNCVNTGVAAGYNAYIGGICGANENKAAIINCASYVSDTNNEIYRRVTDWGAVGSYAGGLTGYNSGTITFSDKDNAVSNRSVAGIVVGRHYVGGLVGYNDTDGTIDINYTLIGGRVAATGDCVGGLVGLNASTKLLEKKLTIKPSSVQGRYYVGGAIGANVVNPGENVTVSGLKVDNSLGTVTAEAFCGGLIGYQRTYTEKDREGRTLYALLPGIAANNSNVPGTVTASTNRHTITITADGNSAGRLSAVSNNMTIRAYAYAGGIIGSCEPQTRMKVEHCLNAGGFDRPAEDTFPGSKLKTGVDMVFYLQAQKYTDAAEALSDELGGGELRVSVIGGVIGVNGENHVIEHCASKGTMNGLNAMGGVVGLNEGIIRGCTLSGSMGSATQDYIGGIAGLNVGGRTAGTIAGTIENCTTEKNCTVTGRNTVGGIVGYNLSGGRIQNNTSSANVSGAGRVGGIAGENGGAITLSSTPAEKRRVNGSGSGVGGVIGVNTATGTLSPASGSAQGDVIAADNRLTVRGSSMVGGIAGINRGTLGGTSINCLTNQAAEVRAAAGSAGGVVGAQEGAKAVLRYTKNLGQVTANVGAAGGIVGMNSASSTVENCIGNGSVTSNDGYAGGVASENYGTIRSCSVGTADNRVTLITRNKTAAGAICAVNYKGGTVQGAVLGDHITISGSAFILGAVVGDNSGTVTETEVSQQPTYSVSASTLQVGGAVGINRAGGTVSKVKVTSDFEKFTKYTYLGGVVGQNNASGKVTECTYSGTIDEGKSAVGNCYGGIAGLNGGLLQGSTVSGLTLTADGVYTATSTSSAAEKERLSSHIGGIAGKNDVTGIIAQCYIGNTGTGTITVKNGMVGGVTGYNKGTITMSGDKSTETLMKNVTKVSELLANAKAQKLSADSTWVKWADRTDVEKLSYNGGSKSVAVDRTMQIIVLSNGNLGGVAGYNAPTGELNRCVSGSWLLVNKSDGIGVGTGGIVGMNESEKDLSYLLNRAFVGRQLKQQNTSRFAGGIIGTQSNKTTSDWTIENCINYGTVYGYLSHYSGGIVGQWTNNGGTVEDCYNYGNLQTTYAANWVGASGGIVAQLYHAASGQDFNILSCQNHGSIYGRWGTNTSQSANDSAGILGNITAYTASSAAMGQQFNINVVDCLNAPGVKIYSGSMASGIVGFFSVDNATSNNGASITASTANIVLNIDRCRNYAYKDDLVGYNFRAGIFGDRYGSAATRNTYIQNCYSVPILSDNGIISFKTGGSTRLDADRVGNNYYFFDTWGLTESGNTAGITYKTDEARNNGAGESRRGYARMAAYGEFDGKFYAAIVGPRLDPTLNLTQNEDARTKCGIYYNMTDSNTRVENGILISKFNDGTEKITGRILFEMPPDYSYDQVRTWKENNLMPAISQKTGKLNNLSGGKIMDDYVREAYRTMEHGQTDKKLDASFTVDLKQQTDGSFDVSIEDTDRPLYYEGRVFVNGEEVLSNLRFIPNQKGQGQWNTTLTMGNNTYGSGMTTGTFQLPASLAADTAGKTITLSVRAVSLFEDTAPSAWKTAATQNVSVLPTPDVNIRLVSHWNNGAKYQISLKNLADYAVFSNWKVTFRLGSQTVTIDQNNHTAEISGDDLKELIVTAAAGITNGIQPVSVTDTIPTDTPKYKPDGSINQLSVSYSGSTVDDCTVTAALTVNEPQMETPPIYRIEVLGTVGTNEYVFAYEDVLTSAGNTVTANFRDLPKEYFAENVTNRRVRAWYAASGLGPVYTYGDTRQTGDASVTLRTYSAEGVQQQDKTIYSHVLGHATDFANYIRAAALNIKPLTAPELKDPVLIQEDNGSISYQFSWTQPGQGTAVPHYSVKLTGITAAGARIGIPVNEVYGTQENPNTSQSFTISADDWQYAEVELTVTRLGQEYGEVGLSTTKKYAVKQRLERPGQPLVINPDTNELEYTIGWSAIGSENGCAGYQIYVQPEGETAAALGELVPVRGGTCSVSRSLEDYAGKTIDLYLVAVAADDSGYADSPNGIVYTMTVPMRLDTPSVKWSYNWNATANNPIPAAGFRSGGLQVTVTPENKASVPPGGSTYLLRAKITGTDGTTVTYPVSAMSESGGSYVCSLTDLDTKYAGCSVRFEARISQSAGQVSSAWVSSGDVVFPRVKLEAPSASLANVNEALEVSYGPMNRLINTAEWAAQLTALSWDEVAEADLYRIELTDKDDKSTTVTVDMSGNLPEIIINGQNTFAVAGDDWYTVKQGSAVNGRYSLINGSIRYYSYQPDTMLQVKDGTFTLKLPNIFSVVTHENQTLQLTNGIQISRVTVIADSKSDRYTESDPAERRF